MLNVPARVDELLRCLFMSSQFSCLTDDVIFVIYDCQSGVQLVSLTLMKHTHAPPAIVGEEIIGLEGFLYH